MPKKPAAPKTSRAHPASRLIDARIAQLDDWRGETLAQIRALIKQADPDITEDWKWDVPVWTHHAIVCTGETYKKSVKLTFPKGAEIADPKGLFNASLEGKARRAIDFHEGDAINKAAFKALIRAAVAHNAANSPSSKPRLLSGGNPQVSKAHGDAPVQAYIAAIPGWKREAARQLDAVITRTLPRVQKAVKWNSPFYGVQEQGGRSAWFLSFHCFDKYLKVAFFRGSSLVPPPPVPSKQPEVRYFHIDENETIDERQLGDWIKQASRLPGERL